jgi:hypothetical protein
MSPDIRLQRWFEAPPDVGFDAYTDPDAQRALRPGARLPRWPARCSRPEPEPEPITSSQFGRRRETPWKAADPEPLEPGELARETCGRAAGGRRTRRDRIRQGG